MTYFMTDELARFCFDSGFEPKFKNHDKILVLFDSFLMDWDEFKEICVGDDEK